MKPIPLSFIRGRVRLSWTDAAWGYENGYLTWKDAVEMACDRLSEGEDDTILIELAGLTETDAHEAGKLLGKLSEKYPTVSGQPPPCKWLFLVLAWVFENRDSIHDPLEMVEMIYSDFDYPEELASFVRYMPVSDGYNPSAHTHEQNQARLIANWKKYLDQASIGFNPLAPPTEL
jgi:hypothetical protein